MLLPSVGASNVRMLTTSERKSCKPQLSTKIGCCLLIICACFFGTTSWAQNNRALNYFVDNIGFEYHLPSKYIKSDSTEHYLPGRNSTGKYVMPISFFCQLESIDKNILIAVSFINYNGWDEKKIRQLNPNFNVNNGYKGDIANQKDTSRVNYYSASMAKQLYNADVAGYYDFFPENPYRNRYHSCQIVFLHKQDQGQIQLFYFYNGKKALEKALKNTKDMIRFLDKKPS